MPWYSLKNRPTASAVRVCVADRIDLGAIAGRQHDQLTAGAARRERRQRRLETSAGEVDAFAQLDRRGAMAEPDGKEAHGQKLWLFVRK